LKMVQNGRISDFHGLLTLTLTLDPGMLITFFHLSSSTTCIQISSKSKKLFVDGRTDGNLPPIVLGRLPKFGSRPKKAGTTDVISQQECTEEHIHSSSRATRPCVRSNLLCSLRSMHGGVTNATNGRPRFSLPTAIRLVNYRLRSAPVL